MRPPPQPIAAARRPPREIRLAHRQMRLAAGIRRPDDLAPHEAKPRLAGQFGAGGVHQRVLAGAGRADHENEHAGRLLCVAIRRQ